MKNFRMNQKTELTSAETENCGGSKSIEHVSDNVVQGADELSVTTSVPSLPLEPETNADHVDHPRIILTLRTKETDADVHSNSSNGKRKPEDCKYLNAKMNGVTDVMAVAETINSSDGIPNKRNLRRLSNTKESVLQNAIALKEKSFGIPDSSFYKKSKSPKRSCDKLNRPTRVVSPKTNSLTHDKQTQDLESSDNEKNASLCHDFVDNSYVSNVSSVEPSETSNKIEDSNFYPEVKLNGSYTCENYSVASNDYSINRGFRPVKRKKRYFKGLSYSFGKKKNSKKKKIDGNRSGYSAYDSSEIDTDSQSTLITSGEKNELSDLKSSDVSAESSPLVSVLFKTATGTQNSKPTSLDVINTEFNEKAPSPSTGDTPEKPARPESTLISSSGGTTALCLCQVQEKVFMKSDPGITHHCQATDSIEGRLIGCCNTVDVLEDDVKLQRPSVKVTYQMFCKVHTHRLLIHNCCPICGLFCTQGNFVVCDSNHMYHRKCELLVENKRICPHCGQLSPPNDVLVSIAQDKYPIFMPLQKSLKDVPSAKMSFGGSATKSIQDSSSMFPPVILPANSFVLPSGKRISIEGLPTSLEKEKLEKYLFGLLSCSSSSPAQRCTYRMLYQASRSGDVEKLMACLASGLNPNHAFREFVMGSALHAACAGGFLTLVHILTQAGAQLNLLDKEQNTSLMLAVQNGHNDIVKYLVKAGANVAFKGKDGMTALHLASKAGNLEACYFLLSAPRSPREYVNVVDDGGWTALVWAAEFSHLDVVQYLLTHGADPLLRDGEHNIALHWAAIAGSVDISEALLRYNSDINCTNVHGDTPLHICARQDYYACVMLLLAQGARTDIRNSAGLLAVDCCINKPCDSYNAIKLNIELKQMTASCREKTAKILTNDITRGHEVNPIQCVNALDDEKEPTDFVYVTENCFTSIIKIDNTITSLKSCKCGDTCSTISCTCGKLSLSCWYTEDGILSPEFNYTDPPMIFECNSVCSCNKLTCKNRVVQHGITGRFQLFRTKNKGWGVITLRLIPKGTYVCEYIGEIISDTEADTREDDSYLFDLDNKDGETYCIDAFRYGNIARFINHCCIPNLLPVKVFINHHDLHFPRIAFFSNRDIQPFEELGFDYGEKFWIIKYKSFTCTCGAENCRYSETTIRKTLDAYNKKLQMEDAIS